MGNQQAQAFHHVLFESKWLHPPPLGPAQLMAFCLGPLPCLVAAMGTEALGTNPDAAWMGGTLN